MLTSQERAALLDKIAPLIEQLNNMSKKDNPSRRPIILKIGELINTKDVSIPRINIELAKRRISCNDVRLYQYRIVYRIYASNKYEISALNAVPIRKLAGNPTHSEIIRAIKEYSNPTEMLNFTSAPPVQVIPEKPEVVAPDPIADHVMAALQTYRKEWEDLKEKLRETQIKMQTLEDILHIDEQHALPAPGEENVLSVIE